MFSKIILFIMLYFSWFVFSEQTSPLYLAFGMVSCLLTMVVISKLKIIYLPNVKIGIVSYWVWLLGQIISSTWDVTKRVWAYGLHIEPQFVEIKTLQESDVGRMIYGNSITLTPGTVTVNIEGSKLLVHALTSAGAEDLKGGEMDKKVRRIC